jgi:hypothetical protein
LTKASWRFRQFIYSIYFAGNTAKSQRQFPAKIRSFSFCRKYANLPDQEQAAQRRAAHQCIGAD